MDFSTEDRDSPVLPDPDCEECKMSCGTCRQAPCRCSSVAQHRSGIFAETLFLRRGNVDVVYATEQTSFDPNLASPTGPIGRVNIDQGTGFRIGASWALDENASVVGTYTWLESDTEHAITAVQGNVLNLEVGHPSVVTSGATSLRAASHYDLDFQLADLDYRAVLGGNRDAVVNYTVGLRYAHLTQGECPHILGPWRAHPNRKTFSAVFRHSFS